MQKKSTQLKRKRKLPVTAETVLANICETNAAQQAFNESLRKHMQASQILLENTNRRAEAIRYGDHAYITQEEE